MAAFDLEAFLNSRGISSDPKVGQEKLAELDAARTSKIADLQSFRDTMLQMQPQLEAQKEADAASWVGQLGLNPDGVAGTAVNAGAFLAAGAGRLAGDVVGVVPEAWAALNEFPLQERHYQAYNRFKRGEHTAEDAVLLGSGITRPGQEKAGFGASTPMELLDRAQGSREVSGAVDKIFDISSIYHAGDRRALTQELGDGFDAPWAKVKSGWADAKVGEDGSAAMKIAGGLGELLFNAGEAAVDNPKAAFQYMVENAPQLFIGLAGKTGKALLGLSNVGYGSENYTKGLEEYKKQNGGQLPDEAQRRYMAGMAASTAIAEQLVDTQLLKSIGGSVAKQGEAALKKISRTGFKNSVLGTAKAGFEGLGAEALTEGYQTFAEGEAGNKPATAKEIYEGAVIGGLSGGGMAGGGRALSDLATGVVASAIKSEETRAILATAETTGDVAALVDPAAPSFDPAAAITSLQAFSARKDATFEEKFKAKGTALDALSQLDAQAEELLAQTPRGNKTIKADLAAVEAELTAADPADTTAVAELTKERDTLKRLAELPVLEGKELEQNLVRYKELDGKINTLSDLIGSMDLSRPAASATAPKADEFEANLAAASAQVDLRDPAAVEVAQASATRIINLSMQAPDTLAPEVALKLANDTSNALSPAQRQHLRVFSEAQQAVNALKTVKQVNKEIIFGDDATKQVGIFTYQRRLVSAVEAGHQGEASRQIKGITKFLASHAEKAVAARRAFEMASAIPGNDPGFKVERTKAGEWVISRVEPGTNLSVLASELKKSGSFRIHKGVEEKFVIPIEQEAQAIKLAQASMQSAFNLSFKPGAAAVASAAPGAIVAPATTTTGVQPNVTVVSPAPQVTAPVVKAPKAITPAAAPAVAPSPTPAAVVPGTRPTNVEAAGVATATAPVVTTTKAAGEVKLQVFHGSDEPINLRSGEAVYVTTDKGYASQFAVASDNSSGKGEVGTFDVTLQNPLYLDKVGEIDMIKYSKPVIAKLKAAGYDGVIYPGGRGKGANQQVLVFDAKQLVRVDQPVEAPKPVVVEEAKPTQADDKAQEAETEVITPDTTEAQDAPAAEAKPAAWLAPTLENKVEGKDKDTFTTTNLLSRVKQMVGNEKQGTVKPLASMSDFLATWIDKGNTILDKLLPMAKIAKWDSTKQAAAERAKDHARDTIAAWTPLLAASIPLASVWENLNKSYRQQDMAQFFAIGVDEQGRAVVPENVLTAMAAAAYQWTLAQANEKANLTEKQVAEMHGKEETFKLNKTGYMALRKAVAFEDTVISDLGEATLQMLGIQADKDTPRDFIPRLQNALGTHALLMLEQRKIVVRKSIQTKQVDIELFNGDGKKYGPAAVNVYVSLARDGQFTPAAEAQGIKEANKGSGGVVEMLFGSDKAPRFAAEERSKFTQKFAKGTNQAITKKQAKAVQQAMDTPHTVIPEMLDLFLQLGRENVLKAAGWKDLEKAFIHSVNLGAVEAQNQNLEQQYDLAMEMMGLADLDNVVPDTIKAAKEHKGWFITHEVWKNYRVGIATQSLNQQTSKIHRYLFQRPNWKTTVDLNDPAQEQRFLVSLGQNLGMKTDKQSNAETGEMVKTKYMAEGTDAAMAADAIRAGNLTDEGRALITKFAAKEGVVALQALQALSLYQAAKARGDTSFEVTLLVGADGKTNGPILTHLALGASATREGLKALLNRGGMFFKGDKYAHYSQFAKDKGQDLYEDLSRHVLELARQRITTQDVIDTIAKKPDVGFMESKQWITKEQFDAFQVISGQLLNKDGTVSSAGRNLVKTPLTAFAFGSSLFKATKSMQDAFVQSFYDTIEDIAAGNPPKRADGTEITLEQLADAMDVLLHRGGGELLPTSLEANGLTLELNKEQLKALGYAFDSVMGGPVKGAMESYFATFIERRRELNSVTGAAFDLYQVAYEAAKAQLVEQLMDSGDMAFTEPQKKINGVLKKTGERKPSRDLTGAEEQQLQELLIDLRPVLHTNFSKDEGNIEAGMFMAKSSMKMSKDELYKNKVSLGAAGVEVADTKALREGPNEVYDDIPMANKPHLESQSRVRVETAPGAAGTPGAIHSSDSSIMHKALEAMRKAMGLNVHDEINTGVDHIDGAASAINEATVDTFLNYSPAAEARDMLHRQLTALEAAIEAGTLPASVAAVIGQVWADSVNNQPQNKKEGIVITPAEAWELFPPMAVKLAYQADSLRLGVMAEMTVMDQYTWEGGQFNVGEDLQAKAQAMLADLDSRESQERDAEIAAFSVSMVKPMTTEGKALYDKVGAIRELYTSKVTDEDFDPIDRTPKVRNTAAMGAPGAIAPMLVAALPGLPVALTEDVAKGEAVVAALNKLGTEERIKATEEISQAASVLGDGVTAWGVLGDPVAESNSALASFLESKGTLTAAELEPVLDKVLAAQEQNAFTKFNRVLLKQVAKLAGEVKIQYVTKGTITTDIPEGSYPTSNKVRGWYVPDTKTIYVVSPEFVHSAVQPEMLLHELLHGVLAQVINNPATEEAKRLVKELETLLAVMQRSKPMMEKFGHALVNVHELVSWGMTNLEFQEEMKKYQIRSLGLENRESPAKRLDGRTTFGKFLKSVLEFVFPGKSTDDRYVQPMVLLMHNTAALFAEAASANSAEVAAIIAERKENLSMAAPSNPPSPLDKFNLGQDAVDRTVNAIRGAVGDLASSDPIKNSRFGPVRFAGAVTNMVAKDLTAKVLESGLILRDRVVRDRQGFVAGVFNSLQGPARFARELLRLAKKNEKARKQMIENTANMVMAGFRDGSRMTDEAKASVTRVFLRSGMHVLLDSGNSMADIQNLLNDPAALDKAIAAKVTELKAFRKERHYYDKQAKALAYLKVAGTQRIAGGMLNAGNIAKLYGTPLVGSVDAAQAQAAEKVIEGLVALYSVQYQEKVVLTQARAVLNDEMARTDKKNGIEQVLLLQKEMDRQSREKLFQGEANDALRMHGYTPEIYNPNTALRTARTPEERTHLKELGFRLVMEMPKDRADPDQAKTYLYALNDGGSLPYLTGATSLKGLAAKGNARYGEIIEAGQVGKILNMHTPAIVASFKPDPHWDPRLAPGTFMTPVLNAKGEVTNWRYLMSDANKDKELERDNRVDYVLGTMAGNIFDKESSQEQNQDVVQAMFEAYQADYKNRPASYVEISASSSNAEMRELYALLPDTMQKQIREVWGPVGMRVPYELLDVIFGYRKLSAAKPFDKMAANRLADATGEERLSQDHLNALEEAVVMGTEMGLYWWAHGIKGMPRAEATTWSRAAGVRVRRTEKAWQEIVGEIKDTIVVRGITTMIGNIKSNVSFLLIQGVNPITAVKDMRIAWKGAIDFKRDQIELAQLEAQLAAGYTQGNDAEMKKRMGELQKSMAANPVRDLIEGGLLPAIVEDVATDFDPYSYKTLLAKKAERFVGKINPGVRTAGRWLYMTHDTQAYKTLSQITQLGDFTARYALHQHLISRKKNPLSSVDAIEEASESFVNYDIAMHRNMQYLDDMGITMFTKYFLQIQRVLLKLGKEKPIQVLLAAALHQYFGRLDLVVESGLPYRLGIPSIKGGPLEAFDSLGHLPVGMITNGLLGNSSGGEWPQ